MHPLLPNKPYIFKGNNRVKYQQYKKAAQI